ncbi:type I-E CRISPR-associated endoribonuclease Cas2 [Atopobacter sp. AH10]|uniref:type I-E CRISPR-associated endoribonuclease Cas2e n=1 Tax=Atopobacter sp. AH10 TaxID=2315861 RepID=UPI000EF17621|nr:type I-E CRISPR-associated endoribonuclease Cas2e [Atopobacter sp. AH10]RLK64288.1 type I-E CRISPR-associated endoribonuclease Cas2 [Atopobacter sp. AH10]
MPFTVIALSKVPPSLRGDLSKWMQEISTGVFIGNFNSRIRVYLWKRVVDNLENGEATIAYAYRNELGYSFECHNTEQRMIDLDGLPIVLFPKYQEALLEEQKSHFSNAAKFHQARKFQKPKAKHLDHQKGYIILDIETTGLNELNSEIIEIAALKVETDKTSTLTYLIEGKVVPDEIKKLTGISTEMLQAEGRDEKEVLTQLANFIDDKVIVGYNVNFDLRFINHYLNNYQLNPVTNKLIDLKVIVKKERPLLLNYKLETALAEFGISDKVSHRALEDVKLMYALIGKLNKFEQVLNRK